jgi:ComF family protein
VLKFENQFSVAAMFAALLKETINTSWYAGFTLPDLIVPMPLHPRRLMERGYNQAREIAIPLTRHLKIPLDQWVIRNKPTLPQSTLPASERERNIANAFSTTHSYQGMHVAILDDVMTTGHTVATLAALLKQHGATRVDIWCCARCDIHW